MTEGIKLTTQEMVDAVPDFCRVVTPDGASWYTMARYVGHTLTHVAIPALDAQAARRNLVEALDNDIDILPGPVRVAMAIAADLLLPPALDVDPEPDTVTIELPRDVVEQWTRTVPSTAHSVAVVEAARKALGGAE